MVNAGAEWVDLRIKKEYVEKLREVCSLFGLLCPVKYKVMGIAKIEEDLSDVINGYRRA